MAQSTITYTDKTSNLGVTDDGKVLAADMNEIKTTVNANAADVTNTKQSILAEGAFVDGDKTKLDGIETAADVTDAANVRTAINTDLAPQTLTDAATIAWDAASGVNAAVTITADRTLGAMTNIVAGMSGVLTVTQDATGGWGLTLNAIYTDANGNLANIAALAALAEISVGWYSPDGTDVNLYIP